MHALSRVFLSAVHAHREEDSPPPWMPPGVRERLAEQAAQYDADFGVRPGRR